MLRVSVWPRRGADLVRSGSLDIEEEILASLAREWANVPAMSYAVVGEVRKKLSAQTIPDLFIIEEWRRLGSKFQQQKSCREHTDSS